MSRPKIKICGLSRIIDIDYVNDVMPEFAGFVFADSRRKVTPMQAKILRNVLDDRIKTVGVFVNEATKNIAAIAQQCGLDVIQLHGDETQKQIDELRDMGFSVWKAIRVQGSEDIQKIQSIEADGILVDTYVSGEYGGSGKQFDHALLNSCSDQWIKERLILAGGLNESNIKKIVSSIEPYAVDVSSGVEVDGYKNENKIRSFCQGVRM